MQSATIYQFRAKYFVIPSSQTTFGVWLAEVHNLKVLPTTCTDESIGKVVLTALAASICNTRHPEQHEWAERGRTFYAAFGTKNERQFEARILAVCAIERTDVGITIQPEHGGRNGGYEPMVESIMRLPQVSDVADLGALIRQGLVASRRSIGGTSAMHDDPELTPPA